MFCIILTQPFLASDWSILSRSRLLIGQNWQSDCGPCGYVGITIIKLRIKRDNGQGPCISPWQVRPLKALSLATSHLWLVSAVHVTWIQASDWSGLGCITPGDLFVLCHNHDKVVINRKTKCSSQQLLSLVRVSVLVCREVWVCVSFYLYFSIIVVKVDYTSQLHTLAICQLRSSLPQAHGDLLPLISVSNEWAYRNTFQS